METERRQLILESMAKLLELPESAYETAKKRYEDLGDWLGRKDSGCTLHQPHIFPQGSFRLGTAIRPIANDSAYDLDLACLLRAGITQDSYSQADLKSIIGNEIENYRAARQIREPKKNKHRCWRLEYQDELSFHMDIVPCIPADLSEQQIIRESVKRSGADSNMAEVASKFTVSITDDRHPNYVEICNDWQVSNPEGFAKWFEARMSQSMTLTEKAKIENLPLFKMKTPLQGSIQLLKRHRDQMFKDDADSKPISIIITTLAARAYQGETDIESAMRNILLRMGEFVSTSAPRVPNPVNPAEDFTDRWSMEKYKHLNLEQNFWSWLAQVKNDFDLLAAYDSADFVKEQAGLKFALSIGEDELTSCFGSQVSPASVIITKQHTISNPPKPWSR